MPLRVLHIISVICLVLHISYVGLQYVNSTHFNPASQTDALGSKTPIWLICAINFLFFVVLSSSKAWLTTGSLKSKWGLNIPETWKEDPAGDIKRLLLSTIDILNTFSTLLMFSLSISVVMSTKGHDIQAFTIVTVIASVALALLIVGIVKYHGSAIMKKNTPFS